MRLRLRAHANNWWPLARIRMPGGWCVNMPLTVEKDSKLVAHQLKMAHTIRQPMSLRVSRDKKKTQSVRQRASILQF
jgi:hypothetical protein